jgi:hypothetical protein
VACLPSRPPVPPSTPRHTCTRGPSYARDSNTTNTKHPFTSWPINVVDGYSHTVTDPAFTQGGQQHGWGQRVTPNIWLYPFGAALVTVASVCRSTGCQAAVTAPGGRVRAQQWLRACVMCPQPPRHQVRPHMQPTDGRDTTVLEDSTTHLDTATPPGDVQFFGALDDNSLGTVHARANTPLTRGIWCALIRTYTDLRK